MARTRWASQPAKRRRKYVLDAHRRPWDAAVVYACELQPVFRDESAALDGYGQELQGNEIGAEHFRKTTAGAHSSISGGIEPGGPDRLLCGVEPAALLTK